MSGTDIVNKVYIINRYIEKYKYSNYLEIGLGDAACFKRIDIKNKVSVDPDNSRKIKPTYNMTSDKFFEDVAPNLKYTFDIVFIDGLHISDQVYRDIENSLKYLSKNGIVILHDCNPKLEIRQKVPRETSMWNGDVWRAFVQFRKNNKNYEYFVVDCDEGCGVIMEGFDNFTLEIPKDMDYKWFDINRREALNLMSVENFKLNKLRK